MATPARPAPPSRHATPPVTPWYEQDHGRRSLASSAGRSEASGPPRTSSTTLSSLWRRALSTPALGTDAGGRDSSSRQGLPKEEWITKELADGMDKEELGRLIEHVHNRVLRERRRRHEAQAEL